MEKENLFFWPLAMYGYAPGEANGSQYPFPTYENGDLFLSWGSIAVKAYAAYKPALALKYVKNVLEQYSKDGLAFQRYGRVKQNGLGDDILSGNSLSIVGLYQAIYGINPLYNRFYLDPHITPELSGTRLKYNFRGKHLIVGLDSGSYSVADQRYKVIDNSSFGFNIDKNQLSYFNGNSTDVSLQVKSATQLTIAIQNWNANKLTWVQGIGRSNPQILNYHIYQLKPNVSYVFLANGKIIKNLRSNENGEVAISYSPKATTEQISLTHEN